MFADGADAAWGHVWFGLGYSAVWLAALLLLALAGLAVADIVRYLATNLVAWLRSRDQSSDD